MSFLHRDRSTRNLILVHNKIGASAYVNRIFLRLAIDNKNFRTGLLKPIHCGVSAGDSLVNYHCPDVHIDSKSLEDCNHLLLFRHEVRRPGDMDNFVRAILSLNLLGNPELFLVLGNVT